MPGYSAIPNADHPGDTLGRIGGSLFDYATACNADCACRAFNSAGETKSQAAVTQRPSPMSCFYVRESRPPTCE